MKSPIAFRILPITLVLAACTPASVFTPLAEVDAGKLPHIQETLVAPPLLPAYDQVEKGGPHVVEVELVVQEKQVKISPRASMWALTFNGTVPAPLIVAHQGDYVQLHLVNPATNTLTHNIDLHAATGAMGGGDLTEVAPGQEATIRFRVIKPGVFVYHCAPGGVMTPLHIASGMNGAIMVLPPNGLTDENGRPLKYDRAYFVAEQDYYLPKDETGNFKEYEKPSAAFADMLAVMRTLTPSHLVFNGVEGALQNDHAMAANVGEKVLFITASCNIDARFHIIGGHADLVWQGGSFNDKPLTNQETWFVPGGSAVAALYQFREPGSYAFVDHNLIKAELFDAKGTVKVDGKWNNALMEQVEAPRAAK